MSLAVRGAVRAAGGAGPRGQQRRLEPLTCDDADCG